MIQWIAAVVVAAVGAFIVGRLLGSMRLKSKLAGSESTIENQKAELANKENDLRLERAQTGELIEAKATLQAELKHAHEGLAQDRKRLEELKESFRALSGQALKDSSQQFLNLAGQTFGKHVESISGLLKPMRDALNRLETERVKSHSLLSDNLRKLTEVTSGLEIALRKPQVRGSWGELVLRNAVEIAGMSQYCDFAEQVSLEGEQGRLRPDMTVRFPGGQTVVVDSKVSLEHFRQALEATDEAGRTELMRAHATAVRTHMQQLSKKEYWKQFEQTPDFAILFLPGESFFSAALEQDRKLIEDGIRNQVLLATPTTLIAMLRTIAFCWQQHEQEANVRKIADAGTEIYSRLCVFAGHWTDVRKGLDQACQSFDESIGSWNKRLLPAAERLKTLGAALPERQLDELETTQPLTHEMPKLPELATGEGQSVDSTDSTDSPSRPEPVEGADAF